MRNQENWEELRPTIGDEEYQAMLQDNSKLKFLLHQHGEDTYGARANSTLMGFDSFQVEGALARPLHNRNYTSESNPPCTASVRLFHPPVRLHLYNSAAVLLTQLGCQWCCLADHPIFRSAGLYLWHPGMDGRSQWYPFENRITDFAVYCDLSQQFSICKNWRCLWRNSL